MKQHNKWFLLLLMTLFVILIQQSLLAQPVPTGRRLREIVADKYSEGNLLIGATTGVWALGTRTGNIMDREFSYVTPENDFKQPQIHPDNSTWKWTKPDPWVNHVIDNNQILRMHGPISPQASSWAKTDTRTAEELETNMRDFMRELCTRFNGSQGFAYLDVVNETINNGAWFGPKEGTSLWENPWPQIGYDTDPNGTPLYIKFAFEIAGQYAPDVKFIYNQHESTIKASSWNLLKETITYLRGLGLRVDGIGWQAHVDAGWETIEGQTDALRDLIDWAHANALEFHVTENSVWLKNGNSQAELEKQAATYRAIVEILIEKRSTGIVGWNTWHIDDSAGAHTEWFPSLFDAQYEAKPAYYAIQAALEENGTAAQLGDVNGDSSIDIIDALLTARYSAGLDPAGFNSSKADVDCSGGADIIDAMLIARYSAGLFPEFSCD